MAPGLERSESVQSTASVISTDRDVTNIDSESVEIWRTELSKFHIRYVTNNIKRDLMISLVPLTIFFTFQFGYPTRGYNIYQASVATWALFVIILIIMWSLCCLVVAIIKTILFKIIINLKGLKEQYLFVFRGLFKSAVYLIWSFLALIVYYAYFALDPFPFTPAGSTTSASFDFSTASWIANLFVANAFVSVLVILKTSGLMLSIYKRRTEVYYERVKVTLGIGFILSRLTESLSPASTTHSLPSSTHRAANFLGEMLSHIRAPGLRHRPSQPTAPQATAPTTADERTEDFALLDDDRAAGTHQNVAEPLLAGPVPVRPHSANPVLKTTPNAQRTASNKQNADIRVTMQTNTTQEVDLATVVESFNLQWKKFDLDASLIEHSFITVCSGTKELTNQQDAEDLATMIFQAYIHDPQSHHLTLADFQRVHQTDANLALAAWLVLDIHQSGKLSLKQLRNRMVAIYNDRKYLARSLRSIDSVFDAAGTIFNCMIAFALFFVLVFLFNDSKFGQTLLSFSSLFLALSFTFGDTAKNIFNSFVFVFLRYAFDAGDRVQIPPISDQPMFVRDIELLTTTFHIWDNRQISVPNHILYNTQIINIRRSENQSDELFLEVAASTTAENLQRLETLFKDHLAASPDEYDPKHSSVRALTFEQQSSLRIRVVVSHRSNWQRGELYHRRHDCIMALKKICQQLNIAAPTTAILATSNLPTPSFTF